MTDTTNHAEVIRAFLLDPTVSAGPIKAFAALDALTRELEDTRRSLRIQADHAAELEKAEVAQSARIATLEEVLGFYARLEGWDQGRHTGVAVYAPARAALAPKEAQP